MVKPKRRKTEKKKPPTEFSDLNDDVLRKIVKFCDFPSSQVLLRTNHRLQTIVSMVKPRSHIHEIYLEFVNDNLFRLGILLNRDSESTKFYPEGSKILVEYSNLNQRCIVKLNMENNRRGIIRLKEKGLACKDVFLSDLKSLLDQMDGPCDIFRIDFESMDERDLLTDAIETIPARKVVLKMFSDNIAGCLRKFQPGVLTHIHLIAYHYDKATAEMALDPTPFAHLVQWRQAEHLETTDCLVQGFPEHIQPLMHFSTMNVEFGYIPIEQLLALKNDMILHIDQPRHREIYIFHTDFYYLVDTFGEQFADRGQEMPRIFPIHQKNKDFRQLEKNRYFARSRYSEPVSKLEKDLPRCIGGFSYFFNVPGRNDVVLRMRFMAELWYLREYGKLEFSFVPRDGVREGRILDI